MESNPLSDFESYDESSQPEDFGIVSPSETDFNPEKVAKGFSPASTTEKAWQEYVEPVFDVLGKIPDIFTNFFSDYQKPLITLLLIITAAISVKVILAVLAAIAEVPLLGSITQLIGIGYSAWFVYRYLWKASTRDELFQEFGALKDQIFGNYR